MNRGFVKETMTFGKRLLEKKIDFIAMASE